MSHGYGREPRLPEFAGIILGVVGGAMIWALVVSVLMVIGAWLGA